MIAGSSAVVNAQPPAHYNGSFSSQEIRAWKTYRKALEDAAHKDPDVEMRQAIMNRYPNLTYETVVSAIRRVKQADEQGVEGIAKPAVLKAELNTQRRDERAPTQASRKKIESSAPDGAIAIADWVRWQESQRNSERPDLPVLYGQVTAGDGRGYHRAKILLDSGANCEVISAEAVACFGFSSKVAPLTKKLCIRAAHLEVSVAVSQVVMLTWYVEGRREEVYMQPFYVARDLPVDLIISYSTINTHDLFSPSKDLQSQFIKMEEEMQLKLNHYRITRLGPQSRRTCFMFDALNNCLKRIR